MSESAAKAAPRSVVLSVLANEVVCRAHRRLTLEAAGFSGAVPGQFVHLGPHGENCTHTGQDAGNQPSVSLPTAPFLRRAFSIGGLSQDGSTCRIELIYHIVGTGTHWMAGLGPGDAVDAIGPLGNGFPDPGPARSAWLVAGGVGLPPLLWFAQTLAARGRQATFFLGVQSADRVALSVSPVDGRLIAVEMPETPLVLATEDGSAGLSGNVVQALSIHADHHLGDVSSVVVYTCGPEGMMRAVANLCADRSIRCYACMERAMACGIGTCQSCVVPVRDPAEAEGWRYALCCTQGPVFEAEQVLWSR
ncbi:MAG: dihydroorotate dehydrogenase electron transfer subunit [Phycisphaerae bacterium]